MRPRWACPDLGAKRPVGLFLPVVGSTESFNDCPAYYLRSSQSELPAEHLIDGHAHPSTIVSEYVFEIESGSRSIETVSTKVRQLVHLWINEKRSRDAKATEMRREKRGS